MSGGRLFQCIRHLGKKECFRTCVFTFISKKVPVCRCCNSATVQLDRATFVTYGRYFPVFKKGVKLSCTYMYACSLVCVHKKLDS